MACAVATLPIPLVASRSILSDAALALKSRFVSSAAEGTASEGMPSRVGTGGWPSGGELAALEVLPVAATLAVV